MTSRRSIPRVGETAKAACGRGCVVSDAVGDEETVVADEDYWPVWTIHWSNGIRTEVCQSGDPVTIPHHNIGASGCDE